MQGLKKTAKSNFGGGNTDWEEKNLGTYAFSETRLIEITESICKDSDKEVPYVENVILYIFFNYHVGIKRTSERKSSLFFQCHTLYEKYEEVIENFWFKHYAKKKETDLREYLCINRVRGTFCQMPNLVIKERKYQDFSWVKLETLLILVIILFQLAVPKDNGEMNAWIVTAVNNDRVKTMESARYWCVGWLENIYKKKDMSSELETLNWTLNHIFEREHIN